MFPLLVSGCLALIGLITVIRSRYVEPVPLSYSVRTSPSSWPACAVSC